MVAGVADHVWTLEEVVGLLEATETSESAESLLALLIASPHLGQLNLWGA